MHLRAPSDAPHTSKEGASGGEGGAGALTFVPAIRVGAAPDSCCGERLRVQFALSMLPDPRSPPAPSDVPERPSVRAPLRTAAVKPPKRAKWTPVIHQPRHNR